MSDIYICAHTNTYTHMHTYMYCVSPHSNIDLGQRSFRPHFSDEEAEAHMLNDSTKGSASTDDLNFNMPDI